jgi:PAS domain S-box-containing protein
MKIIDIPNSNIIDTLSEQKCSGDMVLNLLPALICEIDTQGRFVYINMAFEEFTGYRTNELIGHPSEEVIGCSLLEEVQTDKSFETEITLKDGSVKTVAWNSIEIENHHKTILYTGMEITGQRRIRETRRVSLENFKVLANAALEGVLISQNFKILEANEKMATITSYSYEELKHLESAKSLFTDESWKRIIQASQDEKSVPFEAEVVSKTGKIYLVYANVRKIRYDGSFIEIITMEDITKQKQIEHQLRRDKHILDSLIENSPIGIIFFDKDGKIRQTNGYIEGKLSIRKDRLIGQYYNSAMMKAFDLHGHEITDENRVFSIVKRTGQRILDYRKEMEFADSGRILLSMSAAPIYDEEGFFEGVVEILDDITEQVRTEKELLKERHLLNGILELSPIGIALMSVNKQYVFANKKAEEIVGLSKHQLDQLIYDHPQWYITDCNGEYFPYDDMPYVKTLRTGEECHNVCQVMEWKPGHRRIVSVSTAPMYNEKREVENVISIFQDISEVMQKEKDLRLREEQLSQITSVALEGIIISRGDNIINISESFAAMFGCEPSEIEEIRQMKDLEKFFTPESWKLILKRRAEEYEKPFEVTGVKKDGSTFPIRDYGRIIKYKGEKLRAVSFVDITREKQVENELRYERDLFNKFVETSPIGIMVLNKRGEFTFASTQAREMFGLKMDDISGRTYNDPAWKFTDCAGKIMTEEELGFTRVRTTREPVRDLCEIVERPDGIKSYISFNLAPLLDEKGEFEGAVVTAEDITERKSHEADLVKLNQEIELRAKQLEQSNKDLENFAFIASHDLNEPLNVIKGYASLLKKRYGDKFDSSAKDFMDYIEEETFRMQALIKSLLQLSRVSTRGKPFRTFDVNEEIEAVIKHLESPVTESGAEISYDSLPQICGDNLQIGQVFQNLISNAVKFRRNGVPPVIHITGEERERDYLFKVQDNGRGIQEKNLEKIFDIFQRGGERGEPGSGIGLAITKKIVNRHGGDIWAESEPGRGSTFFFTIPKMREVEGERC